MSVLLNGALRAIAEMSDTYFVAMLELAEVRFTVQSLARLGAAVARQPHKL
jgi:hypothetical protein